MTVIEPPVVITEGIVADATRTDRSPVTVEEQLHVVAGSRPVAEQQIGAPMLPAPRVLATEAHEEIVEVSIGAINLRVEAPQTVVQAPAPVRSEPAPERRTPRSGLARRYLRSF
jgi:hypothetical protein